MPTNQSSLVVPQMNLPTQAGSELQVALSPEKKAQVAQIVDSFDLESMPGIHITVFGQDPVNRFSSRLDTMLREMTKAESPVAFEVVRRLTTGVDKLNLPKLEKDVRRKMDGGKLSRVMGVVKLRKPGRKIEQKVSEVQGMLRSKATSLQELTSSLEEDVNSKLQLQLADINRLNKEIEEFESSIEDLGVYVDAGQQILKNALEELAAKQALANESKDPIDIKAAQDYADKVKLLNDRLSALQIAYAEAPANQQALRLTQEAGLETFATTLSQAPLTINAIKQQIVQLVSLYQTKSSQDLNRQFGNLRSHLKQYTVEQLSEVSISAVRDSADERLRAAQELNAQINNLRQLRVRIESEKVQSQAKLEQARQMLATSQHSMMALDQSATTSTPMLGANVTVKLS